MAGIISASLDSRVVSWRAKTKTDALSCSQFETTPMCGINGRPARTVLGVIGALWVASASIRDWRSIEILMDGWSCLEFATQKSGRIHRQLPAVKNGMVGRIWAVRESNRVLWRALMVTDVWRFSESARTVMSGICGKTLIRVGTSGTIWAGLVLIRNWRLAITQTAGYRFLPSEKMPMYGRSLRWDGSGVAGLTWAAMERNFSAARRCVECPNMRAASGK